MSKKNKQTSIAIRTMMYLSRRGLMYWISDKTYISIIYRAVFGKKLDLSNPKTFNEKLNWLKLYNRKIEYTTMVDKYAVKKWVADKIGQKYVIPTLGVWDSPKDINFEVLPDQFVLKCNHDSGGIVICKDKNNFDKKSALKILRKSFKNNGYGFAREWPYKNVKKKIIAEEYLADVEVDGGENDNILTEYKIFCFNGNAKMVLVCKGQAHGYGRTDDYCDLELKRMPFMTHYPNSKSELKVPKNFSEMLSIAERLSDGIPVLRVDLYLYNENIYVGELTFFNNAGFGRFEPDEWDKKLGDWIQL